MHWWKRLKQVCFYEHGKFHVPWLMRNIQKGLYNEILLMKHKYHKIHVCNIHALETRDWRTQASKQELAGAWFESKRTLGVYIMIQSILKAIGPGISLEGMMLKLKLQYFGHLMWRADSLEKTLMLGGIGGRRRKEDRGWDGWMASLTWWTWVWVNSGSWWGTGRPGVLWFMGSQRVRHDWATDLIWSDKDLIF